MRAKVAADRLQVSIKTLRYYEAVGLIEPVRLPNGYRDYSEVDIALTRQVATLTALGLSAHATRPFVECLRQGHRESDDCVESLVAYRNEIARLDALVAELTVSRAMLQAKLEAAAATRGFAVPTGGEAERTQSHHTPPARCAIPTNSKRADHLLGQDLPSLTLLASDGTKVDLRAVSAERWVLFIYPTTGVPGEDMPRGWDEIPGARGCTVEACGFRDHIAALRAAGAAQIFGLSVQATTYQQAFARRLRLPYGLLSDTRLAVGTALTLPTFTAGGDTFYQRLTLIIRGARIEHVFFPVSKPNEHAQQVLVWFGAPGAKGHRPTHTAARNAS